METALILILVAVLAVFLIRSTGQKPKYKKTPRRHIPPARTPPEPFASDTAKAAPGTIKGAAFVIDGDTIRVDKTQIRLFGIDAPELDHPFGKKAKWALLAFCKGQKIRAEVTEKDAHGRTVARCFLPDGRDLSAEMVKQGLAIDWPKFSGGVYQAMETPDARKKLWLADARQKGRMHVREKYEAERG